MRSETPARLPVIDFSKPDLKPGTHEWDSVKVQVRQAIHKYGCFEALFDKVLDIRKAVFGSLEELFNLPSQKKKLYVSDKPLRGFYGRMEPIYESFVIDDANIAENIEQRLTNILWPEGNASCSLAIGSETLLSFSELASGLEKTIRRMILESFGLEKYTDELLESTNYILRVMKYGPQTSESSRRAHSDQNMVSLLYQNEVNGLEIQTKEGEWIKVKPSSDTFIVIIGESLHIWLNGQLSSPYHRVIVTGNKARYCAGLFAAPRGGHQVKAPEEIANEENPPLFKPFDYEEFLGFYAFEIARGAFRYTLKDYCSV